MAFLSFLYLFVIATAGMAQSGSPQFSNSTRDTVGGLAVFETLRFQTEDPTQGTQTTQIGVLPSIITNHAVFFATASSRLSRNLGIALANLGDSNALVMISLRRDDGTLIATKTLPLLPLQQKSQFISEIFADVGELSLDFNGSVTIDSTQPVGMLVIRFRETEFTWLPVESLSNPMDVPQVAPGIGGRTAAMFADVAVGGGWTSEIVMNNTTSVPMTVRVDLFQQDGTPLVLAAKTPESATSRIGSSFPNLIIPGQGLLIQRYSNDAQLQVGYAIVTVVDDIPPMVTSTDPASNATLVAINDKIDATSPKRSIRQRSTLRRSP